MNRPRSHAFICLSVAAGLLLGLFVPARLAAQTPAKPASWKDQPLSGELVDQAVRRGIDYLWKAAEANPNKEGNWESYSAEKYKEETKLPAETGAKAVYNNAVGVYSGQTCLALLAMLKAGVNAEDPRFQKAFKSVIEANPRQTYAHATRAALLASLNSPSAIHLLEQEKKWLLDAVFFDGSYGYFSPANRQEQMKVPNGFRRDLSNTQYGVLGIWYLSDTGRMEIPAKYWQLIQNVYVKNQCADGGWNYDISPAGNGYESLTAGGIASLFIVWDKRFTERCEMAPDPELVKALEKGLDWMKANFAPDVNAGLGPKPTPFFQLYTLYGIERVGVASGLKFFGEHNWWDEGARYVLHAQRDDGSWPAEGYNVGTPAIGTAYALLFLSHGRAPVVFNKLAYGGGMQWNSRPRDLARLTAWMSKTYERLFNWQMVPIDRPLDELLEAPILLMSGKSAIILTTAQKNKLREYVLGGGLLLGEAAGDSRAFADSFRAMVRKLFPELEMKLLPPDHPIYNAQFKLKPGVRGAPPLEGLSNGVRTLVLLSPRDLGCNWQSYDIVNSRPQFELGGNLMLYVSDLGKGLINRGASYLVKDLGHKPARTITVGRLTWGNKSNWDPEPYGWRRMDVRLRNADVMGVATTQCDIAEPPDPKSVPLVHVTGIGPIQLTDSQKAGLKKYVADGGLVLADAAGGNAPFAESFQKLAGELWAPLTPANPPFLALAQVTDNGKVAIRHIDGLPRATRPIPLTGYQSAPGRWGVLLLSCDLTAAMAGYPNLEPVGLLPDGAEKFLTALLSWRAAPGAPATGPTTVPAMGPAGK